jgi:geranylgeranyl pyrophosphate synthase
LFHAFLLAHDDIIDSADTRRDRPSLHRQLASLDGGSLKFGTDLAIVAGDLLFSGAMRLLHELDLPGDAYRDVLRSFSRVACLTGSGQVIDICQSHEPLDRVREDTLLREYHWKTAAYTFEGPMLSGAIAAGACENARAALSRFALSLGQAYQLQNDLCDLAEPAHPGCDLVQGKRTVTLMRARATMDESRRRAFDETFASIATANGHAVGLAEGLRRELRESGAIERTEQLIGELVAEARAAACDEALGDGLRAGLGGLLGSLESAYFVRGA